MTHRFIQTVMFDICCFCGFDYTVPLRHQFAGCYETLALSDLYSALHALQTHQTDMNITSYSRAADPRYKCSSLSLPY